MSHIRWVSFQSLAGGMMLGAEEAFGCPPLFTIDYEGVSNSDAYVYYMNEIRHKPLKQLKLNGTLLSGSETFVTKEDTDFFYKNNKDIDVVVSVPICSGLSVCTVKSARGGEAIRNDNMLNITKFVFTKIRPKVFIFENAPALYAKSGELVRNKLNNLARKNEYSVEVGGHGIFSNLLIEALNGGATDILGNVTPGSIYAFIDQALGPWAQRPLFKANISSFVSLKKNRPKIEISDLKDVISLFPCEDSVFALNPSYEKTNIKGGEHKNCEPYANKDNVSKMTKLQLCNRNGLIIPFESTDMYFAAMDSKGCVLTPLGKHYWKMIKEEII